MLATDEVDEDYFTPAANTTLANIFGNHDEDTEMVDKENESLKFTPPKKPNTDIPPKAIIESKPDKPEEESKTTECVYACALTAHEWEGGKFAARGLLGFAILKITKTNCYNIVLYDSKKLTLSSVEASTKLRIMYKKDSRFLSYYDSLNKYWSLHGKESEIEKILEILANLGVIVKYQSSIDKPDEKSPELSKEKERNESEKEDSEMANISGKYHESEKETDTDSSVNRKTKASILQRMANMGQAVLPPKTSMSSEKTSDSSDTDEFIPTFEQLHKVKSKQAATKRGIERKTNSETLGDGNKMAVAKFDMSSSTSKLYALVNGQLVPAANSNDNCSDLNLFMSEQRMNNNELRISINKTTDKLDKVLNKIKYLEQSSGDKNVLHFQMDMMQKLMGEYEEKIKRYEQILQFQEKNNVHSTLKPLSGLEAEIEEYKKNIIKLKDVVKDKEKEIEELRKNYEEIKVFKEKEIEYFKTTITSKNEEVDKLSKELVALKNQITVNVEDTENTVKEIMNDVYNAVSENYKDEQTYSGEQVKKIIASVIKEYTYKNLKKPIIKK